VVGPPPLPHSCPSPTLTLGARPPGGLMAHVTEPLPGRREGSRKEPSKEAVAEREPVPALSHPVLSIGPLRMCQPPGARACIKQSEERTFRSLTPRLSQPSWTWRRPRRPRCRHPPLAPSRSDSRTTPRPHPDPIPCRRESALAGPDRTDLSGTSWPICSHMGPSGWRLEQRRHAWGAPPSL